MTDMERTVRRQVSDSLILLYRYGLVQWSSGNISARCGDRIIIKPSGVPYHYNGLSPDSLVAVDMKGAWIARIKPSVDTPIHLGVYKRRPDVNAIVHTHSTYATAFAVAGECIPPVSTMAADVFGGPIPCSGIFLTDHDIASVIAVATMHRPAMLLKGHGVFTVGESVVEEVAKVTHLARQRGWTEPLPAGRVQELHRRYQEGYGQNEPS
jgi:L-ribulose-5-phosphate 4-epimerase